MKTVLVTCGETSGEHHASRVVSELQRRDPSCRVIALGGRDLAEAGADVAFPMERFAFMGFLEVLSGLPRVLSLERKLKNLLKSGNIDLFIPVDYPGLNLRLARCAHGAGVPVLYFISPQVWAWGAWRLGSMRRVIDLMAVILPFEEKLYRDAGIPVVFTGHPLLDEVPAPREPKRAPGRDEAFTVMLFPGSRRQEVGRLLPVFLEAARMIKARFPAAMFKLGLAPLIDESSASIPPSMNGFVSVTRRGIEELSGAALTLAVSGTVTLQSAISGTPTVVSYRTSRFTYLLGKRLVSIPWIAMPNVLAERKIVPELIQGKATPERIAREAETILGDGERYTEMSGELLKLRETLTGPGGADLVAGIAIRMANGESAGRILETVSGPLQGSLTGHGPAASTDV